MNYPTPVKLSGRICFGIAYFLTEEDAQEYAKGVELRGETYNGGFFRGMLCGREASRDYIDPVLGPLSAVTER